MVDADIAIENWPNLVLNFLESNIRFESPTGYKTSLEGKRRKGELADYFIGRQIGRKSYIAIVFE